MKRKKPAKKIAEHEKNRLKKKASRKVKRFFAGIGCGVALLGTGYFLGVHRKVIKALIKGEEPPKAPKGHCFHK